MKIPVFVSCPTDLSDAQQVSREAILSQLDWLDLEPRAIGRSDYPVDSPLSEVLVLARHCSGGLILGYSQLAVDAGTRRPGTARQETVHALQLPSPWNHLEAGILFSLRLPLLVFRDTGVHGGIFDLGTGDVFVHQMPASIDPAASNPDLRGVLLRWQARVRDHYYRP